MGNDEAKNIGRRRARLGVGFVGIAALASALAVSPAGRAADVLPIFDAHVHYSRDAWSAYGPQAVIGKLKAANVVWALVSSTPDDGTLKLYEADPWRIVPELRPYRRGSDRGSWYGDSEVLAFVEARLRRMRYAGIGEFHLHDPANALTPQVARMATLAVERDIVLHVHSGAGAVEALFGGRPELKILWAHAGMSEPPRVIGGLLDRYPRLWAELSFRAGDIAPAGELSPTWRALFMRHPDRFVIGTDTYITPRWDDYGALVDEHRQWLNRLPRDVAEAVAWRNAVRILGVRKK